MKSIIRILSAIIIFSSIQFAQNGKQFGNELTVKETTEISTLLSSPDDNIGKRVLVEGTVIEVCEMAGCWLMLQGKDENEKIKVKVKDGEIVFPTEAKGLKATVEGELYKIEMDEEMARDYLEHVAEEQGKEFDRNSHNGQLVLYQLKGIGAVIYDLKD